MWDHNNFRDKHWSCFSGHAIHINLQARCQDRICATLCLCPMLSHQQRTRLVHVHDRAAASRLQSCPRCECSGCHHISICRGRHRQGSAFERVLRPDSDRRLHADLQLWSHLRFSNRPDSSSNNNDADSDLHGLDACDMGLSIRDSSSVRRFVSVGQRGRRARTEHGLLAMHFERCDELSVHEVD